MTGPSSETPALLIKDAAFRWGDGFGIEVSHLTVDQGERALLLGESGSGKSTLLSLVCGIIRCERGTIRIADTDIAKLRGGALDRLRADRIGVIFQQFNLLPFATPLDNILLPLRFSRERRNRIADPRGEALHLTRSLGLEDSQMLSSPAATLSVGQQQRVAVARAIIGNPDLILADEPASALDANAQEAFLDLLFQTAAEAGSTLIMVTHDERLAARFDRTIQLSEIARVNRSEAA